MSHTPFTLIHPMRAEQDALKLVEATTQATVDELRAELTERFRAVADDLVADAVEAALANIAVRARAMKNAMHMRDELYIQTTIKVE